MVLVVGRQGLFLGLQGGDAICQLSRPILELEPDKAVSGTGAGTRASRSISYAILLTSSAATFTSSVHSSRTDWSSARRAASASSCVRRVSSSANKTRQNCETFQDPQDAPAPPRAPRHNTPLFWNASCMAFLSLSAASRASLAASRACSLSCCSAFCSSLLLRSHAATRASATCTTQQKTLAAQIRRIRRRI